SMHRLTARAPARCPIMRGRLRRAAQRPLPSMMTARWRGRVMASGTGNRGPGTGKAHSRRSRRFHAGGKHGHRTASCFPRSRPSYRHQFLFLRLDHLVDILDALVGELLDLVGGAAVVVLGDLLLLEQVLDLLQGVAADVADRDLGVLALAV